MSQQLPAVKPKQLIRVLEREGWQLDRVRGSHHVFRHPERHHRVVVPVHGRDLRPGTLRSILDAAGISRDDLRRLL